MSQTGLHIWGTAEGGSTAEDFMHKVETFDPLPHEEFLDLAKCFRLRVVNNGEAGERIKKWGC